MQIYQEIINLAWCWWLMLAIHATQEAEMGRITV
jgi:hypothetical protein